LSLGIYLDDCAYAKSLVVLLEKAGHLVVTPAEAGTLGLEDAVHLRYAADHGLAVLTYDADDFAALHEADRSHAGILAVYRDNNPDRDMTYADLVRTIGNLEAAGVAIAAEYHVLNAWRY
jgi:predicted glycosyl hydrolase (DUF1957 family)